MKPIASRKSEQNRTGVDPWTLMHLSVVLTLGLIGVLLLRAFPAAVAYERAEQVFERYDLGRAFFKTAGPEVVLNALVDAAVLVLGHRPGQKWSAT